MQKIMEPLFEILYLLVGLAIGIFILVKSERRKTYVLFGIMALILVFGDAFHLVPRILNSWNAGGENIVFYLGIGKLITSVTMTFFYILLYWFFKLRYEEKTPVWLDVIYYALAVCRIVLCALPQNHWTSANPPYLWGVYRNIPFVIMGIIFIVLSYVWAKKHNDKPFKWCFLAITLSFAFYLMTVTLTVVNSLFGLAMLPKTVCYVWILCMGLSAMRKERVR